MKGDYILRSDAIKAIEDLPNCYNGFSDTLDKNSILQPITDEMYSTPVSGYIER